MTQLTLQALLETKITVALDVDRDGHLLLGSNRSGTMQLYELVDGQQRALTELAEPVTGSYLPGSRAVLMEMDSGGNERHQLYRLRLEELSEPVRDVSDPRIEALTSDPQFIHHVAGVTPDGRLLAYTCNRRNGIDFDVWLRELDSGQDRPLFQEGGWCHGAGISPDGRWLAVVRPGLAPKAEELLLINLESGEVLYPLGRGGADTVGSPTWLADSSGLLVSTNADADLDQIVHIKVGSDSPQAILREAHDLSCFGSQGGSLVAVVANQDGSSDVRLHRGGKLEPVGRVELPEPGAVQGPRTPGPVLPSDDSAVFFTFSSPRLAGDVYSSSPDGGRLTRLTTSPGSELWEQLVAPVWHRVPSFDGEHVPVAIYKPADDHETDRPAVLLIHGGPESQSVNDFNPVVQALVARGYVVGVPNVRGSTGYGRRYYSLDDTVRRLDSVADLAAIHRWLPSVGVDPKRVALWGGSYGGYMVLAGLAFQPELWAAAVDIVGISDLVTFLENTSPYRRTYREREYGSLASDREFLERASPLRKVDQIRAPLFIIHGKNDPRVPLGEAEQMAASLRAREIPCELHVYADEGHGLAKLVNRLDAYPKAFTFLDRHLTPG